MYFTSKKLEELLGVSKMALSKALRDTDYELKAVEGSTKKVKHYKLEDLPQRYRDKLESKGIKIPSQVQYDDGGQPTNILQANTKQFSAKYLTAPQHKQYEAVLRVKFIEFYLKKDASLNVNKWIEHTLYTHMEFDQLGDITQRKLFTWKSKYEAAKTAGENIVEALFDARGAKKQTTALTKEQQEMAIRFFIKKSHPIVRNIHLIMSGHFGEAMPSYDALNNFYHRWKKENPQTYLFSKSPDKWKNNYLVAIGDESEKARYRNHFWEFDATPADIICSDGKRYTILGLIDIATRRPIFRVEDSNSSFAVSRLLRSGILKFGIPENIVVDNGKEFVSNHFESMCMNLEIQIHITPPFSGDKKPFIERMFGTLARGLFRELHGFIGHNVAMREEIQAVKSFGHKIMAQKKFKEDLRTKEEENAFADLWKISKENIGIELEFAITKEELQDTIDTWVSKHYEQVMHGGLQQKPIQAWNSYSTPVKSISDPRMLDLLLGKSSRRKVLKKGISFEGAAYWDNELLKWMGKHVQIMTHDDMGEIIVYDPVTMQLICKAVDNQYTGKSREAAHNAKVAQKRVVKSIAKSVKEAVAFNDPTLMSVIEAKTEQIKAQTVATTKQTKATNMLLNESAQLEEADEKALEESNNYNFKNKDENGIPQKVLENGRPAFKTFTDKFVWLLEHPDEWSDKDKALKEKRPEAYDMAVVEFERKRA